MMMCALRTYLEEEGAEIFEDTGAWIALAMPNEGC
jgi:hypothetical protein